MFSCMLTQNGAEARPCGRAYLSQGRRGDERGRVSHHPSSCKPYALPHGRASALNPAPLLLKSLDLAPDQLALERRGAVDEDDAVAVVGLVEHAARFKVEAVELELFAVQVLRAHDGTQVTLDLKEDARERQA